MGLERGRAGAGDGAGTGSGWGRIGLGPEVGLEPDWGPVVGLFAESRVSANANEMQIKRK